MFIILLNPSILPAESWVQYQNHFNQGGMLSRESLQATYFYMVWTSKSFQLRWEALMMVFERVPDVNRRPGLATQTLCFANQKLVCANIFFSKLKPVQPGKGSEKTFSPQSCREGEKQSCSKGKKQSGSKGEKQSCKGEKQSCSKGKKQEGEKQSGSKGEKQSCRKGEKQSCRKGEKQSGCKGEKQSGSKGESKVQRWDCKEIAQCNVAAWSVGFILNFVILRSQPFVIWGILVSMACCKNGGLWWCDMCCTRAWSKTSAPRQHHGFWW